MKEANRYFFKDEKEITVLYEFDTEEEVNASGLLDDPRRTTCFTSSGKYFVGGHFAKGNGQCKSCVFSDTAGQPTLNTPCVEDALLGESDECMNYKERLGEEYLADIGDEE